MTGEELKAIAIQFWGERGYVSALAKSLKIDRTQVWRYIRGASIPGPVEAAVTCWKVRFDDSAAIHHIPDSRKMVVVHFIGFAGDEYWSAVRLWGKPHFIHRGWDLRARRDIGPSDLVIFAQGEWSGPPRVKSFNDIDERWL